MKDREFLEQFEICTLPYEEWTHRSHIKVGYLYVRDNPFEQAMQKMRDGIRAYNAANAQQVKIGYHETITRAFLHLIRARVPHIEASDGLDADGFCEAHPDLLDKRILSRFYSDALLRSADARSRFVPADLSPLPAPVKTRERFSRCCQQTY